MRFIISGSFIAGFLFMVAVGDVSSEEMQRGTSPTPVAAPAAPVVVASSTKIAAPETKMSVAAVPEQHEENPGTIREAADTAGGPADTATEPAEPASDPSEGSETPSPIVDSSPAPEDTAEPSLSSEDALDGVDLSQMRFREGKYRQRTADGREVVFTVDAVLQKYADTLFAQYEVPAGAAVVLNSRTGRVIALSQERRISDAAPSAAVALDASPPAASLFKIVTAAALVDNGIPLERQTCYSGGSSGLNMHHIEDVLPKNHACADVATALGRSINAIFAKLSDKFLNRTVLQQYAAKFGFNHPVDFDVPLQESEAEIPAERLERARTAAGFWHTHLSPLHAASIAQSLAQDGALLRPYVVDSVADASGNMLYRAKTKYLRHIVSRETADLLRHALVRTTQVGTARKSFHDANGRPYLPGIDVAGKTGTLTGEKPYRAYTWFVGLAPLDKPEVAVAVLVVNSPKWRIKAPQMAALILKKYFEHQKSRHN